MPTHPGRGNGLFAASYVPLADLDPRVADAALTLLAGEGIAAYAAPASERSGQFVTPRVDRVLDRLHVDSTARERARALLAGHLSDREQPGPGGPPGPAPDAGPGGAAAQRQAAEDAAWAALIANWDAPVTDQTPRWPAAEDVDDRRRDRRRTDRAGGPDPTGGPTGEPAGASTASADPSGAAPADWGPGPGPGEGGPVEAEAHFVPPAPPPVPRGDAVSRWAWAGALGAPVFFFVVALTGIRLHGWMLLLGVAAFVGGFVTLVARMKDRPGDGHGPDDGAVV